MMLCESCSGFSIKLLREGDYIHQPSLEALQLSAELGCNGCKMIHREIGGPHHNSENSLTDPSKPRHVWFKQSCMEPIDSVEVRWMGEFRTLWLAADDSNPASRFVKARTIDPDPTTATTYGRIKSWIHDCVTSHPKCGFARSRMLPTRVLDVLPPGPGKKLKLYISCKGEEGDYVALSYCYSGGNAHPAMTTRANFETHKCGILENSLPKTIRDAISVSRDLGIRFLWIDALCIIQDSLNGEDWQTEASKMCDVYSNAYVTISAEAAKGANQGFLFQRTSEGTDRSFLLPYFLADGSDCGFVYLQQETIEDSSLAYLSSRAWAFQERRLSTRVLDYRAGQISLTCRTGMIAETSSMIEELSLRIYEAWSRPISLSVPAFDGDEKYHEVFLEWYKGVENYSRRHLTYGSDKMPALSGYAHAMHEVLKGTYLAGIWKQDLLVGLLWSASSTRNRLRRPSQSRCPSWSWAALDGGVDYHLFWIQYGNARQESGLQLNLVKEEVRPVGVDIMGQVLSGRLSVSGHMKRVRCLPAGLGVAWGRRDIFTSSDVENWDALGDLVADGEHPFPPTNSMGKPFAICLFDTEDVRPTDIWCLAVVSRRGIVLEYLADKDVYIRVGYFMFSDPTWMSTCHVSTITIV